MRRTALFAILSILSIPAVPLSTTAATVPVYTGTYTEHGTFETIRLDNGEMLDVTAFARPGDMVYGQVFIDGVLYTIYDKGPGIGPTYAVPQTGF